MLSERQPLPRCPDCPSFTPGGRDRLILKTDVIQFHAGREAGYDALSGKNEYETPEELADSLSQHRIETVLEGGLGWYSQVADPRLQALGIKCAKRLLAGKCQQAPDWHVANLLEDPESWPA